MSAPLVVIGASLGGLDALGRVLGALPKDAPAAFAVVQHRRPDSDTRLVDLLRRHCPLPIGEAEDKEPIVAGTIRVAPADYHLLIDDDVYSLNVDDAVCYARPSIDVLFESAADASPRVLAGVLLTASSEDGAAGIQAVSRAGGKTIVQDPDEAKSAVAPLAALSRTKVDYVLELDQIGSKLLEVLAMHRRKV